MMSYLLPGLSTLVVWLIGRAVLSSLTLTKCSEALAIMVGVAVLVIALGDLSFVHMATGTATVVLTICGTASLVVMRRRRLCRHLDWREIGAVAAIFVVASTYFWLPLLHHRASIALIEAGDFSSYVSMAGWLQRHPITQPADMGAGYNPLQYKLLDHQAAHLRLGALFLSSFYASLFGGKAAVFYTSYVSWLIVIQSIAFFCLARALIPSAPILTCALPTLAFAINPLLTWSGYASFLPQILGIALAMAGVSVGVRLVDERLASIRKNDLSAGLTLVFSLLLCANWSAYPEITPVVLLILGLYAVFSLPKHECAGRSIGSLVRSALFIGAMVFVLSPMTAVWGARGMLIQLSHNPHGGEQATTAANVLLTLFLGSVQPLIPDALDRTTILHSVAGGIMVIACLSGLFCMFISRRHAFIMSIFVATISIFAYVLFHYTSLRTQVGVEYRPLLTWNLFKASQYMAPFIFATGLLGFTHALTVVNGLRWKRWLVLAMPLASMLVLAFNQYQRVDKKGIFFQVSPQLVRNLDAIPPGRILILAAKDTERDRYRRWLTYALLPDRQVVSVRDAPGLDHEAKQTLLSEHRSSFLRDPIAFVLEDNDLRSGRNDMDQNAYRVSDHRNKALSFQMINGASIRSYASVPSGAGWRISVYNVTSRYVAIRTEDWAARIQSGTQSAMQVDIPENSKPGLLRVSSTPAQSGMIVQTNSIEPARTQLALPRQIDDLTTDMNPGTISDGGGKSMSWSRERAGFVITKGDFGFSRMLIRRNLTAGAYTIKVELGDVVAELGPGSAGLGAYIGFDNRRDTAVDLSRYGNKTFYYRFNNASDGEVICGLGFGAWGSARGIMHVRSVTLIKED